MTALNLVPPAHERTHMEKVPSEIVAKKCGDPQVATIDGHKQSLSVMCLEQPQARTRGPTLTQKPWSYTSEHLEVEVDLTSTQQRLPMHAVVMCTFAGWVEAFPPHTVYLELPHVLPSPVIRAAERMNRTLKQHQPNIAKKQTSLGRKSATCLFSGHCMPFKYGCSPFEIMCGYLPLPLPQGPKGPHRV